jgi:glycine/D-amino acid oxidase-like deaminating enzyme
MTSRPSSVRVVVVGAGHNGLVCAAHLARAGFAVTVLSGKARWSWQHSIPATKELRYSITLRTLKRM